MRCGGKYKELFYFVKKNYFTSWSAVILKSREKYKKILSMGPESSIPENIRKLFLEKYKFFQKGFFLFCGPGAGIVPDSPIIIYFVIFLLLCFCCCCFCCFYFRFCLLWITQLRGNYKNNLQYSTLQDVNWTTSLFSFPRS